MKYISIVSTIIIVCCVNAVSVAVPCHYDLPFDINSDCRADLLDFAEFAFVWLVDCNNDPNNSHCIPLDLDYDGYDVSVDCNDDDPNTYPGAEELMDGIDNNCNGEIDESSEANITSTSYSVIPNSASFTIYGTNFIDVTNVSIGVDDQSFFVVESENEITVNFTTAVGGAQDIVVTTATSTSPGFSVEIIQFLHAQFLHASLDMLAHGSSPTIIAASFNPGFLGVLEVSIGGVSQSVTPLGSTTFKISDIPESTPVGMPLLEITTDGTPIAPISIMVTHLVINEVDSDQTGSDTEEFVEISTSALPVSLDGYVLVFYNGNDDASYFSVDLYGYSTDATGFLLVGNAAVSPEIVLMNSTLQNGADAVAIYQGDAFSFPNGTFVHATGLIDAVVYGTNDPSDIVLLSVLLGSGPEAIQVNEGVDESIQRCTANLLDARAFSSLTPTPREDNSLGCPP